MYDNIDLVSFKVVNECDVCDLIHNDAISYFLLFLSYFLIFILFHFIYSFFFGGLVVNIKIRIL